MKTKLVLVTALVATLMFALFLVGCGDTAQTHPRTVKDVDLTKYADMEVGSLVVVFPGGTEKKYDVAADFWAEQEDDTLWFFDEYKYALIIEKGVVEGVRPNSGTADGDSRQAIFLKKTGSEEEGTDKVANTRVAVASETLWGFGSGSVVLVCGNIPDKPSSVPVLSRNTQVVEA